MKVLYVYQGDWPRNATRVLKQTKALAENGHTVRLLCANPRNEPMFSRESWMEIERVPRLGSQAMNRYLAFPLFVNPFWLTWILRSATAFRPDAMIVRDLPLAPAAIAVGKIMGIPVHYEMADVYPVAMRSNAADHPGLISRFTRNPAAADWIDKQVITGAASVFVVSEESRQRCIAFGASPENVLVVGNTPATLQPLDAPLLVPADLADWAGRPIVMFIGNLLADRGLVEAIDAIGIVRKTIPDASLVIIGDGREADTLQRHIDRAGLAANARMLGWKGAPDHAAYYRISTIGILPFLDTEHINITLANKLFDYMGAQLPIVASDGPPMRRIIEETKTGVLVPPGNAKALAGAIVALLNDPVKRARFGRNGRAAVEGTYSWKNDRARFLHAIERFGSKN